MIFKWVKKDSIFGITKEMFFFKIFGWGKMKFKGLKLGSENIFGHRNL